MSDTSKTYKWALMFTGHMSDLPDRETPRFPADLEDKASDAIHNALEDLIAEHGKEMIAITSCARGADILFVEACHTQGIPVHLVLPMPADLFVKKSVEGCRNSNWEQRFWDIWQWTKEQNKETLKTEQNSHLYDACNKRIIELAQEKGETVRLLALWDGEPVLQGGAYSFIKQAVDMELPVHEILLNNL